MFGLIIIFLQQLVQFVKKAILLKLSIIRKQKDSTLNIGEIASKEISKSKNNCISISFIKNKFTTIKKYHLIEVMIYSVLFNRKLLDKNKTKIYRFAICSNSKDNRNIQNIIYFSFLLPKESQ